MVIKYIILKNAFLALKSNLSNYILSSDSISVSPSWKYKFFVNIAKLL